MTIDQITVGMLVVTNASAKLGHRGICGTVVCIVDDAAEIRIDRTRYSPHGLAIPDGYRTAVYPVAALDPRPVPQRKGDMR